MRRRHHIEAAYRTYGGMLQAKCRRMLSDPTEAEEIVQETFLRLCTTTLDFHDTRRVAAWLYTTSTRLAIDRIRRRTRWSGSDPARLPTDHATPARIVAARKQLERLARDLPAEQLELLVLWRIDRIPQDQIAEITGLSPRTVRRRLHHARQALNRLGDPDV